MNLQPLIQKNITINLLLDQRLILTNSIVIYNRLNWNNLNFRGTQIF